MQSSVGEEVEAEVEEGIWAEQCILRSARVCWMFERSDQNQCTLLIK